MSIRNIFVFDLDSTLIEMQNSYSSFRTSQVVNVELVGRKYQFNVHEKLKDIETWMNMVMDKGHEVWILTASYFYTKEFLSKFFKMETIHKIRVLNGTNMAKRLDMPFPETLTSYSRFSPNYSGVSDSKGAYLRKVLTKRFTIERVPINCTLYDDSEDQITPANFDDGNIKISGFLVNDFKVREWHSLFTNFASAAQYATRNPIPPSAFSYESEYEGKVDLYRNQVLSLAKQQIHEHMSVQIFNTVDSRIAHLSERPYYLEEFAGTRRERYATDAIVLQSHDRAHSRLRVTKYHNTITQMNFKRDFIAAFRDNDSNSAERFYTGDNVSCNSLEFCYLIFLRAQILSYEHLRTIALNEMEFLKIFSERLRIDSYSLQNVVPILGDIVIFRNKGSILYFGIISYIDPLNPLNEDMNRAIGLMDTTPDSPIFAVSETTISKLKKELFRNLIKPVDILSTATISADLPSSLGGISPINYEYISLKKFLKLIKNIVSIDLPSPAGLL